MVGEGRMSRMGRELFHFGAVLHDRAYEFDKTFVAGAHKSALMTFRLYQRSL
jgi:hypothetical protein